MSFNSYGTSSPVRMVLRWGLWVLDSLCACITYVLKKKKETLRNILIGKRKELATKSANLLIGPICGSFMCNVNIA